MTATPAQEIGMDDPYIGQTIILDGHSRVCTGYDPETQESVWEAAPTEWQPIESAPKDGTQILVWHDHESDPYWLDKPRYRCTSYAAWAEGSGSEKRAGRYIAVWGGGYHDVNGAEWGPPEQMPDWWFKHDSEFEQPLAPTHWQPLPGGSPP